jgi:ABC-type multidrug transport system fused ATPase/permease subunit
VSRTSTPLRTLASWTFARRRAVALATALGAIASALEVASIGLVGPLLLVGSGGLDGRLGPLSWVAPVLEGLSAEGQRALLVGLILAGISLRALATWGAAAAKERIACAVQSDLRARVFSRFARAPMAYLDGRPLSEAHATVLEDTERVHAAAGGLVQTSVASVMALCYAGLLFALAPALTCVALAGLGVVALLVRRWRAAVEAHATAIRDEGRSLSAAFLDALTGFHLWKSLGRTDDAVARFERSSGRALDANRRQRTALEAIAPVAEVFGAVVVLAILWLGATLLPMGGGADRLLLLPYVFLFYRLLPRFLAILAGRAALAAHLPAVRRTSAFLDDPATEPLPDGGEPPPTSPPTISFEGVTFGYGAERAPVLRGVDLVLEPGRTTALVGASGAGKSTVVDLLLGLRRPDAGRVTVDGRDLTALCGDAWRRLVGVVPQDPRLFEGSVRENLRLVAPDADDARLFAALDAAGAAFVRGLEGGLDAPLHDRGSRLSGGERQRVAIARALVQDPLVLVFDEATSHLDPATERDVVAAISAAAARRTTLVIAHRLSTVRLADRVAVLSGGRVVECGSPEDLLALDGEFARWTRLATDAPATH